MEADLRHPQPDEGLPAGLTATGHDFRYRRHQPPVRQPHDSCDSLQPQDFVRTFQFPAPRFRARRFAPPPESSCRAGGRHRSRLGAPVSRSDSPRMPTMSWQSDRRTAVSSRRSRSRLGCLGVRMSLRDVNPRAILSQESSSLGVGVYGACRVSRLSGRGETLAV